MRRSRNLAAIGAASIWMFACGEIARAPSVPQTQPKQPPAERLVFQAVDVNPQLTPELTTIEVRPKVGGEAPNLGAGGPLFSNAGAFNLSNTSPGSADFTLAPVIDYLGNTGPTTFGTGSWSSIAAGGNTFSNSNAESIAGVLPDDLGTDYLLLSAYTEEIDPVTGATIGTVMHAIVLASDFTVGGSVNLDGIDRLAIFARGDINLPDPELAAAAVTGTITFSAGGLAIGDLITASLTGDFGEFNWAPSPQPNPSGTLTAGSYTLTHDPNPNVFCDGTLIGQEAQFAAVTAASIGFADGPILLAIGAVAGNFDISGAPITSGYGVATLTLEGIPDAPPGVVGGFVNGNGAGGPGGTTSAGTYLMLDGTSATTTDAFGQAGAGFLTAAQDGFCSVDFLVQLGP